MPASLTAEILSSNSLEATLKVTISSDGGSGIFEKGVIVSVKPHPTIDNGRQEAGRGPESFQITVQLSGGSNYIRAYAINAAGVGYGNDLEILGATNPNHFTVSTSFVTEITTNSAKIANFVSADLPILARGICWNTSPNPTINDSKTNDGTGFGNLNTEITGLTPHTLYYARVYARDATQTVYGDDREFTTLDLPTVTTLAISNAGTFIITTGGSASVSDGSIPIEMGVCWSTSPSPTIADDRTIDNVGPQVNSAWTFISRPFGLSPNTTYYFRAYGTSQVGTGYGNELAITMPVPAVYDGDGNPYSSVTIGANTWLVENLKTGKFANGDDIPALDQFNDTNPGWLDATTTEFPWGKLYNGYAVADPRNICPSGWRVSADSEWELMMDFLGGGSVAGGKLKESGIAYWQSPNDATNSTGFTALPGGSAYAVPGYQLNVDGVFWTTTAVDADHSLARRMHSGDTELVTMTYPKVGACSVRCVKE